MIIWIVSLLPLNWGKGIVGCLPISFNLSVRALANSFTVPMVGIGLGVPSEEELSEVIESGLFGLFGLVGNEAISD